MARDPLNIAEQREAVISLPTNKHIGTTLKVITYRSDMTPGDDESISWGQSDNTVVLNHSDKNGIDFSMTFSLPRSQQCGMMFLAVAANIIKNCLSDDGTRWRDDCDEWQLIPFEELCRFFPTLRDADHRGEAVRDLYRRIEPLTTLFILCRSDTPNKINKKRDHRILSTQAVQIVDALESRGVEGIRYHIDRRCPATLFGLYHKFPASIGALSPKTIPLAYDLLCRLWTRQKTDAKGSATPRSRKMTGRDVLISLNLFAPYARYLEDKQLGRNLEQEVSKPLIRALVDLATNTPTLSLWVSFGISDDGKPAEIPLAKISPSTSLSRRRLVSFASSGYIRVLWSPQESLPLEAEIRVENKENPGRK